MVNLIQFCMCSTCVLTFSLPKLSVDCLAMMALEVSLTVTPVINLLTEGRLRMARSRSTTPLPIGVHRFKPIRMGTASLSFGPLGVLVSQINCLETLAILYALRAWKWMILKEFIMIL